MGALDLLEKGIGGCNSGFGDRKLAIVDEPLSRSARVE
jgi:hypothetical protein